MKTRSKRSPLVSKFCTLPMELLMNLSIIETTPKDQLALAQAHKRHLKQEGRAIEATLTPTKS
jgi:hypothetical protein